MNRMPERFSSLKIILSFLAVHLALVPFWAVQSRAEGPVELVSVKVKNAPMIDGKAGDAAWSSAKPIVTYDPLANIKLTLRSVYIGDRLYFLVSFPDKTENRHHKTQIWVPGQSRYRIGADREDTFVLKWSMEAGPVDLRVDAKVPYKADIWFWKAHRTDHAGYADDKMHVYSSLRTPNTTSLISKNGSRFYLTRSGDSGGAAYKTIVHGDRVGDRVPLYNNVVPQGSRADVRAKGVWRDGVWTVEIARKLATGNADDVQFDLGQAYAFGVSRYEIAGRKKNSKLEQPWYGAGEITEILSLRFK
jgi:hypothetical protein